MKFCDYGLCTELVERKYCKQHELVFCLYPECKKQVHKNSIGLCTKHQTVAEKQVKKGKVTWEKLKECKKIFSLP